MPNLKVRFNLKSWDDDFCVPAAQFIQELADLIAKVPADCRDLVQLEFDRTGSDYDYSRGEMSLHYTRLETDDEMGARLSREAASRTAQQTEHEARERREFERLKAKFKS